MERPEQSDEIETSKKRARDDKDPDLDDSSLLPSELAKMSRSERKRHREKKRRSDVNKGFDDLMALLLEIDPTVRAEAEDRARRGQWKGTFGAQEDNMLSRVDLISRAVDVLRRVHRENEERKQIIATFTETAMVSQQDSSVARLAPFVANHVQNQGRVDSSDVVNREVGTIWYQGHIIIASL
jgi:Helix-loop-helix DNA-binding domain